MITSTLCHTNKNNKKNSKIVTDEHHEDRDKKHEEEGHTSKMRNMLKPMSKSSFFRSSDINKDHWTLLLSFLWGK